MTILLLLRFNNVCFPLYLMNCSSKRIFFFSEPIVVPDIDRTPLRRHRCFKKHELQILHQAYNRDPHPTSDILRQLATQLQTPLDKVRVSDLLIARMKSIVLFSSNGSRIVDTVTNRRNAIFQQLVHQPLPNSFSCPFSCYLLFINKR